MAELAISKKAPLVVTSEAGVPISQFVPTSSGPVPFHIEWTGGSCYVVPDALGTGVIDVESYGATGSLEVTVVPAPLVVELGAPEPK